LVLRGWSYVMFALAVRNPPVGESASRGSLKGFIFSSRIGGRMTPEFRVTSLFKGLRLFVCFSSSTDQIPASQSRSDRWSANRSCPEQSFAGSLVPHWLAFVVAEHQRIVAFYHLSDEDHV